MRQDAAGLGWKQAVYCYVRYLLPLVRALEPAQIAQMERECVEQAVLIPLHIVEEPITLASWEGALTGAQVTALMLSCLWLACGETREGAGVLLKDWPDLPMWAKLA